MSCFVRLFKLNESGHFDPCSNNNGNIIALSCYILLENDINLTIEGLSFVPTLDIDKTAMTNAVMTLGRTLKIKYFFRGQLESSALRDIYKNKNLVF